MYCARSRRVRFRLSGYFVNGAVSRNKQKYAGCCCCSRCFLRFCGARHRAPIAGTHTSTWSFFVVPSDSLWSNLKDSWLLLSASWLCHADCFFFSRRPPVERFDTITTNDKNFRVAETLRLTTRLRTRLQIRFSYHRSSIRRVCLVYFGILR